MLQARISVSRKLLPCLPSWRLWFLYCLLFLTYCLMPAAHAQRFEDLADTVFQNLGTERGLPHPIATAVTESSDGFIWVGTQGGLARWDGYRFRSYLPIARDINSLPDVWVQALHVDRAQRLWIATYEGGLARYVPEQDHFVRIPIGPGGLSHASVSAIIDDGDGGIFIATYGGLNQLMPDTGGMRQWQHHPSEADSLPDNRVYALAREKSGDLWIGTAAGLARQAVGKSGFEKIALPLAGGQVAQVRTLSLTSDGSLWLGTRRHGVFVRPPASAAQPQPAIVSLAQWLQREKSPLPGSGYVPVIKEIAPGQIWLGSENAGIIQIDQKTRRVSTFSHDLRLSGSLPHNTVLSMWRDRAGMIWVASRGGLSWHDPRKQAFLTVFGGSSKQTGISDENVWSLAEDSQERIWLGLAANGVDVIDRVGGKSFGIRPDATRSETALPPDLVLAMAETPQNNFLIGTSLGLYLCEADGKRLQRISLPGTGGTPEVRSLLRDKDKIWIGTSADGLWQMDFSRQDDDMLQRVSTDWLAEQRINVIEPGPRGTLWLGSRDSLILFDPATRNVEKIMPRAADTQALASSAITGLLTDLQGRLWVATFGAGINILEKRDKTGKPLFHRLGTGEGLPHVNINKLLRDKQGNIWASTDNGLAMINPHDYKVRSFGRADGVPLTGYWARSGTQTARGELLFGAVGGITIVRPELLQAWLYQPPLVFTDVRVGGKAILANRFNRPQQSQEALTIMPNANSLTVEFSALDFTAPERNKYAYRLQGYDDNWQDTDADRRLAAYTNLPPGQYVLRIRASNRSGHWIEKELQLPVRVIPAWHQTWWFLILQILSALVAAFALLQIRTRYLRQHQMQLEYQVRVRTSEMQDSNLHLQQANQDLEQSADTLRQLGEVGRDITANLDVNAVFEALHRHVGGLLDTSVLVIYRTSADDTALESGFGRQDTQILPTFRVLLDSPSSNAARAARERREILLERKNTSGLALPISGSRMLTSLYAPLVIGQRLLGVMSIQSRLEHAYGERERMIFRTLCAYGAIALANAEALAALHAAQSQLVQQEKLAALGGLVAGVAHEVNTPIGNAMLALSGNSHAWQSLDQGLLNSTLNKNDLQQAIREGLEYTDLTLQNIKRAAAMITSFQGIAVSYDSDQVDVVNLARYLPDVVGLIHADFEQFGHELEMQIAPDLEVEIVTVALTEVLSRIFANILDHAFASGRAGKVVLKAYRNSQTQVEIVITDNGQGIPADALPKVFEPFYTSMSGSGGHVGLGMHVVYNHVTHRLRGRVQVESTLGQGTTVRINLPSNRIAQQGV